MQIADRCAPSKIANIAENLVLQALQFQTMGEEQIGAVTFLDWLLNEHLSWPIILRSEYDFFFNCLVKH
jgi:hypothetical protein